jgi:hypothetical protein
MRKKKEHVKKKDEEEKKNYVPNAIRNAWTKFESACVLTEGAKLWINPNQPKNSGSEKNNFILLLASSIHSFFFHKVTSISHKESHTTYSLINCDGINFLLFYSHQ